MNTMIGTKLSMTQRFVDSGAMKTVTIVSVKPHTVAGVKSQETHGYNATVIATGSRKKVTKSFKNSYIALEQAPRYVKEVRGVHGLEAGQPIQISDVFKPGDIVKVVGTSKGKGFTGVVKRHGFAGGPKTHGQSDRHRAPGSIGAGTDPGRVFKGLRMAGRSGGARATVRNLTVMHVDDATGRVYLSGPIPGHYAALVQITKIGEEKNFSAMVLTEEDKAITVETAEQTVVETVTEEGEK